MNTLAWLLFAPLLVPAASSEPTPEPEPTSVSTPAAFDESALTTPRTIDVKSEVGVLALAGVRAVLDAELSESDRRFLGKKVLSASRVTLAEGTFAAGGTMLVAVNVELRRADPLEEPLFISGVFTLDEGGSLASMIVPPKSRTERYDLDLTGDVDSDAREDVLLSITGSVPHEQLLVTWDDGVATTRAFMLSYDEGC